MRKVTLNWTFEYIDIIITTTSTDKHCVIIISPDIFKTAVYVSKFVDIVETSISYDLCQHSPL